MALVVSGAFGGDKTNNAHEIILKRILVLAAVLLFVALPVFSLFAPPVLQAQSSISLVKKVPVLSFGGDTSYTNLYHTFDPSGLVIVKNQSGDTIYLQLLDVGYVTTVQLLQLSSTMVAHKQIFKEKGIEYTVWTYFDFARKADGVKITYSGNLPYAGKIKQNLQLPSAKVVGTEVMSLATKVDLESKNLFNMSQDDDLLSTGIGFDWADAPSASYIANGSGAELCWSVGSSFVIDPSTVATSTDNRAVGFGSQRHSFYAQNMHWVFYSDGVHGYYKTSTDGITWNTAVQFRANITVGYHFSIFYDGTYMHYCYNNDAAASPMYYRRGRPEANGTITWSAAEQTAIAGVAGTQYRIPAVAPDSAGYIYIGYRYALGATIRPYVTRSGNNDGTWGATPAGFPYQLDINDAPWRVAPTPVTATKMVVMYVSSGGNLYIQSYSGTAWNAAINTGIGVSSECAAVGMEGQDDVHVFSQRGSNNDLIYWMYQYSTNTFVNNSVAYYGGITNSYSTLTYDNDDEMLYAIWSNTPAADKIYYKRYDPVALTWDAEVTLLADETVDGLGSPPAAGGAGVVTSHYWVRNDVMAAMYQTGLVAPFNVRYAWRTTAAITIEDVRVFSGYLEEDDWLIVVRYDNRCKPYYDTGDIKRLFELQFRDSGDVVRAKSVLPQWGHRVANIYLSAESASAMTYGGTYCVDIKGLFSGFPRVDYQLVSSSWMGSDLTRLDDWVIGAAGIIGTSYTTEFTTYVGGRGEVLNAEGGVLFNSGINGLSAIRPNLFQTYSEPGVYNPEEKEQAGVSAMSGWQIRIGPDGVVMLTRLGNVLGGIDGGTMLAIIFVVAQLCVMGLAFTPGHTTAANILSVLLIVGAVPFGINFVAIGILCLIAAFLFFKRFYMDTGQ